MARYRTVEIKKGDLVHDMISGFSGTVVTKINRLHGTVEWVVESERTPMTPSQSHPYTEKEILRLKVLGNVVEGEEYEVPPIKLGDIVQDRISQFKGTVAHKIDRLFGTVEWLVESESSPQMPSEVRAYAEKELPRLIIVASAFDQEKPVMAKAPKPPRPPKKAHKRR